MTPLLRRLAPRLCCRCPHLLYAAVALLFLMPMPLRPRTHLIQTSGDGAWHLWWLWWIEQSVYSGRNPYFTDRLLYPSGASLYLSAMDMVSGLVSIPLHPLLGGIATYNLLVVLALFFSAATMRKLALELTGSPGGALVAGAAFAFMPLTSSSTNLAHLQWINLGFIPLAVLGLLRIERGPCRSLLPRALPVALATLVTLYQGLFLLVFTGLYAGFRLAVAGFRRDWAGLPRFVLRLGLWGGLAVAFVAPVLVPTVRLGAANGYAEVRREFVTVNSADVLGPFSPNPLNPILGGPGPNQKLACAFGYVVLTLAVAGVLQARGRAALWVITVVVFYFLSLGPSPEVGTSLLDRALHPYDLIYGSPFGKIPRTPIRILFLANLGLAILVAWGVVYVQRQAAQAWRVRPRTVTAVLLAVLLLESWPGMRPLSAMPVHPFYDVLARSGPGAVLELPRSVLSKAMYYQTVHGHPIVGAYLARYPPEVSIPYEVPGLRQLWIGGNALRELTAQMGIDQPQLISRVPELLDAYGLRYVLLHLDARQLGPLEAALREALPESSIVWNDSTLRAYRIPEYPERTGVVAGFGPGWAESRLRAADGERYRSSGAESRLILMLLDREAQDVTLRASALGWRKVPIAVDLNSAPLARLALSRTAQVISLPLRLRPGYNSLGFRAEGRTRARPDDGEDSFALGQISVEDSSAPADPSRP